MATTAPYGAWASPISAELVAAGGVSLDEVRVAGDHVYWIEGRPLEGGRQVVCRARPGTEAGGPAAATAKAEDLVPEGFNARTRVHEYGGGAYALAGGTLFFSNFADQRLYRLDPGAGEPRPITPEPPTPAAHRYADAQPAPDGRRLVCVRERHEGGQVHNELVALPVDGGGPPVVLAAGRDFYASPRVSPDGRRLAWLEWDHPNMPWDGTELKLADLGADGLAGDPVPVAGGPEESVFQPEWSPDGVLHLASDRSGWWNLYRAGPAGLEPLHPAEEEFGHPQWVFGLSTYAFLPGGRIACIHGRGPMLRLGILEPDGTLHDLDLPFSAYHPPQLRAAGDRLACLAGGPTRASAVVLVDPAGSEPEVLRSSEDRDLDPGYLSVPEPVEFPTAGGRTAHALYYPPANRDFQGPAGERPPLVVASHGGPTAGVSSGLHIGYQYFASRGIAVVDVDYGGSTGYGRAYRKRLEGEWGIVDVQDCVAAAHHLAGRGDVDPARLAIRGGSAGGYTTLCALTFTDEFSAGASYYGVADAVALATDTHKFESRYLDRLIGPWPEAEARYRERSPIHFTDRLSCPVILLQGLEDAVVPPSQAEMMAAALDAKGIPYAYLPFEGEQHGFRQAAHIRRALEAEVYFYSRVFGFDLADPVEPVPIAHLRSGAG
ncbi:MAG TPA: S9 family peptidase [Actinomycetota bacterium]|jgi:dipeptidyl aminopeptidase/acylaminoacyl peptidase|nr:S9 family peptidase [Actinomycetota bacterium]